MATTTIPTSNDYHPNVYEDEKMAAELTAYLRKLMGWF